MLDGNGAVLEAPFRENGHVKTGDGFYTAPDDIALEGVKLLQVIIRQRNEGNAFGLLDDGGPGEGSEAFELQMMRWGVGASAGTAEAAGIGQGMLYGAQSPSLLVEHAI